MANDKETKTPAAAAAPAAPAFNPDLAGGLTNFAAKLPQYDPGADARTARVGVKGHPIHGYMLGTVDLPSTIKDPKTGEVKPWVGIVIELLQPCPVKEGPLDNRTTRIALKGERIILTESTAFSRFSKAADHPTQVFEALIVPEVGRTKAGQSLWNFPEVRLGRPLARTERHLVGVMDLLPEEPVHNALPEHASAAS